MAFYRLRKRQASCKRCLRTCGTLLWWQMLPCRTCLWCMSAKGKSQTLVSREDSLRNIDRCYEDSVDSRRWCCDGMIRNLHCFVQEWVDACIAQQSQVFYTYARIPSQLASCCVLNVYVNEYVCRWQSCPSSSFIHLWDCNLLKVYMTQL